MKELEKIFNQKLTENGDDAYISVGNVFLDILFKSSYYQENLKEVPSIKNIDRAETFSMFIRDPRFGLGLRDLGRVLMSDVSLSPELIVKAGRFDDLYKVPFVSPKNIDYLFSECKNGNELAKKWMPRYSSKDLLIARNFAKQLGMNKQTYGHFIKTNTVENTMSRNQWEDINFEHVPSLAAIKYVKAFQRHQPKRYLQYIEDVKAGKKELHIATTNVYDIYKNRNNIDADVFYNKIEKINISCIPIIDVSGSMFCAQDAIGKALSIGKYLSDCSTYCPSKFITFSQCPELVSQVGSTYVEQIAGIKGANWGFNTNFSAVTSILSKLKSEFPDYLVILSDMEFDAGSSSDKDSLMEYWKEKGIQTKIVWWNFNSRNQTCPETDNYGNIFLSGYNPMLLKYLEVGFDSHMFLNKLLDEYENNIK